jgi:hypothetical protein
MKTSINTRSATAFLLCALALAACWAFGSDDKHSGKIESKEPVPTFSHGTDNALSVAVFHPARYLSIACGKSWIEIDYRTGAVKLPKDVPLDEAAIQFWRAVEKPLMWSVDGTHELRP